MTAIANGPPTSNLAATTAPAGTPRPVAAAAAVQVPEAPAVIVSIAGHPTNEAQNDAQTDLQYAILGTDGWISNYNNADYAKIAARDGADVAATEKASLLHAALSAEASHSEYAAQRGLSTGAPITFDTIKTDPQTGPDSPVAAKPAQAADAQATTSTPTAPFSAAAAGADVALATLTSLLTQPTSAKPGLEPRAIGGQVSTSV